MQKKTKQKEWKEKPLLFRHIATSPLLLLATPHTHIQTHMRRCSCAHSFQFQFERACFSSIFPQHDTKYDHWHKIQTHTHTHTLSSTTRRKYGKKDRIKQCQIFSYVSMACNYCDALDWINWIWYTNGVFLLLLLLFMRVYKLLHFRCIFFLLQMGYCTTVIGVNRTITKNVYCLSVSVKYITCFVVKSHCMIMIIA